MYLYFSIENGQPREPALCQLYRMRRQVTAAMRPVAVSTAATCQRMPRAYAVLVEGELVGLV